MTYVDSAPTALICLYERKAFDGSFSVKAFRLLLEKLLCNRTMTRTWKTIRKCIKSDEVYRTLWWKIIQALADAKKGSVLATDQRKLGDITKARRKVYGDITKTTHKLSALIAKPQRIPPDGTTPLYRGELDLPAYEFLPETVASMLGARSWATMESHERRDWADSVLSQWPTMVELLDQLAIRASQLESNTVPWVPRDRGNAYWVIYVRKMYEYFCGVDRRFKSIGFAPIKDITNISMIFKWERQNQDDIRNGINPTPKPRPLTAKKVRTIICGASGKRLPIKRIKKQPTNW